MLEEVVAKEQVEALIASLSRDPDATREEAARPWSKGRSRRRSLFWATL